MSAIIPSQCAICGKATLIDLDNRNPLRTKYWLLIDFPNPECGIIQFCGPDHALEYHQLTND